MNPVISIATSRIGPKLGILIGRLFPAKLAKWLAGRLAAIAAARPKNQMVRAVRANQSVVRNLKYEDPVLRDVVFRVFRNAAEGYMTFFQGLARGRKALAATCSIAEDFAGKVKASQARGKGVFIVGPHMGNFDLALVAFQDAGINPLVLTYRTPHGSYVSDNAIRRSYGVELTPISAKSLRTAMRRLNEGGVVLTLVDRPDEKGKRVRFFGRPAIMPTGHARMALRSGAVLQVGVALKDGARHYRIEGPGPIETDMLPAENEAQASIRLTERVLEQIARFIQERPDEWLMYYPVWPQAMPD